MVDVVDINKNDPHCVSEVICVNCLARWIDVYPVATLLKDLVCPRCGAGYVILTGQETE